MAKPSSSKATAAPQQNKKRPAPAANEIDAMFDDLFASKAAKKSKSLEEPPAVPAPSSKKRQKKDKGKGKAVEEQQQPESDSSEDAEDDDEGMDLDAPADLASITAAIRTAKSARKAPVTIVDPSAQLDSFRNAPGPTAGSKKRGEQDAELGERFADSRGTRRRTDDGLAIYQISELKIGLGGDTPDCPFDCQCCF